MLEELSIKNIGLIESLQVSFAQGFNAITGETGVGKSMLLGSIGLLLGDRANSDLIRHGETQGIVTGVFRLSDNVYEALRKDFEEFIDDKSVYIRRVITKEGRSKSYIGDVPVALQTMRNITSRLVEVHGQHEHQSMGDKNKQIILVDRFGETSALRKQFGELLQQMREKQKILDDHAFHEQKRKEEKEYLEYQLNEFEELDPKPNELEISEKKIKQVSNRQKFQKGLSKISYLLQEGEQSISQQLKIVQKEVIALGSMGFDSDSFEKTIADLYSPLDDLISQVDDAVLAQSESEEDVDAIIARCEKLKSLYRKHQLESGKEDAFLQGLVQRIKTLSEALDAPDKLKAEIEVGTKKLFELGHSLSKSRQKSAKKLEGLIEKELKDLGMPEAKLNIAVKILTEDVQEVLSVSSVMGLDDVEFMFNANVGEPMRKLRDIASGGELARTMLSVAKVLSEVNQTGLIIFDEIDANIGGRLGTAIGEKMKTLAKFHQVICVTHLPQIAGYASTQYRISKESKDKKTRTHIELLDATSRIEEIAEMIQGKNYNDITIQQAKELLKSTVNSN